MLSIAKIKELFRKGLNSNNDPKTLAFSFCLGIYIAFSPFPGAHTIMMVLAKFLFRINFPILFIATSFNNPWTMIPFFSFDYFFGYWFTHSILGLTPGWVISLEKIFGSGSICVWSFIIGGNVLGIFAGIASYPFAKIFFTNLALKRQKHSSSNELEKS